MDKLELLVSSDPTEVKIPRAVLRSLLEIARTVEIAQIEGDFDPRITIIGEVDEKAIEYVREVSGIKQAAEDLKWIAQHLAGDGEFRNHLTNFEHIMARSFCNGFGEFNSRELLEKDFCWDWSHVRDSTPEALTKCREYIEGIIERLPTSPWGTVS